MKVLIVLTVLCTVVYGDALLDNYRFIVFAEKSDNSAFDSGVLINNRNALVNFNALVGTSVNNMRARGGSSRPGSGGTTTGVERVIVHSRGRIAIFEIEPFRINNNIQFINIVNSEPVVGEIIKFIRYDESSNELKETEASVVSPTPYLPLISDMIDLIFTALSLGSMPNQGKINGFLVSGSGTTPTFVTSIFDTTQIIMSSLLLGIKPLDLKSWAEQNMEA